jgi:hypothetical protein
MNFSFWFKLYNFCGIVCYPPPPLGPSPGKISKLPRFGLMQNTKVTLNHQPIIKPHPTPNEGGLRGGIWIKIQGETLKLRFQAVSFFF